MPIRHLHSSAKMRKYRERRIRGMQATLERQFYRRESVNTGFDEDMSKYLPTGEMRSVEDAVEFLEGIETRHGKTVYRFVRALLLGE